ncbi:ArsR family transcriptional regulator [Hylemonella gracilis str. Niagara R]|uniref:ArsR family transcriptional regulator n=1 Tax=Hylemonella gracilis str. Niagara R TaxID=1458275 RepID=A0A016XDV7_9BURK|nr:metalloregulator ArsR/SmtB family transcription factor [Hylemonella gracilis]EYC50045.1 ArsR family transcriptional regulator [Hylemonella gracilis str. Niagara R]
MKRHELKDLLYEQVSRIGKAVSSPKRLEILEVLGQGEKTVEALSAELGIDIKLTSAHLKTLREARLVETTRAGKYIHYRLSGPDVANLWVRLREVAEEHLVELRLAVEQMVAQPEKLASMDGASLMERAKRGEVIVIDVRPQAEFQAAHLPFARSMPLSELEKRLAELPPGSEIVAYCRGPFCMLSDDALQLLRAKGYKAHKILGGVCEWQAAGLPLEST